MDESNDEHRVIPELYFLISKFLSGGPLKETAKTLLKELESIDVLPRRLDWEGAEHAQSYDELASQYSDMSWQRLAAVCSRALQLAGQAPSRGLPSPAVERAIDRVGERLEARLSLLSESLVRPPPLYASHKRDHSLARRLLRRELGGVSVGSDVPRGMFPARLLSGLQLQRRTLGHLSAVYCVSFDRRGRYLVTGADDMLVKVWRAADGCLVCTLRGARAEITDVCVSDDGALLAAGSVDRLVRVWALSDGAPRATLAAHSGTVTSVAWAPPAQELRWLASTSTDCSVCFWACSPAGRALSVPVQFVERMRPGVCHMVCAAWSAGGAFLAAGSADHHVRVYALTGGAPRRVLEVAAHADAVDSLSWARRGLRFVSGSKDGTAALWALHAAQWRATLLVPAAPDARKLKTTMVCWDCSGAWVLTAASDRTLRVWCARAGLLLRTLTGHTDDAYVLEPHPFLPAVFLSAGHDGQLFVWDAMCPEPLARFHNRIEGHGDGALFDAKWGSGTTIAASDSHGHLLLLGLGRGHKLYGELPCELFFHTDYRPLVCDAGGVALDEQSGAPPHLLPPPFLVDVEGAPHAPRLQRLVPGREHLALAQLVPAPPPLPTGPPLEEARGVWRGEGVRHTAWQPDASPAPPVPPARRLVPPLPAPDALHALHAALDMHHYEETWYRREMRRRPVMISTAGEGGAGVRRRAGRKRRAPGPRAAPGGPRAAPGGPRAAPRGPVRSPSPAPSAASSSHESSDEWQRRHDTSRDEHDSSLELSDTTSSSSSSSSAYSDWEGGTALAPPARARRRPRPAKRYSPPGPSKRVERTRAGARTPPGRTASPAPSRPSPIPSPAPSPAPGPAHASVAEAEASRPADWITAVTPKKSPYHPQMGDELLYFRLGHERYFEAVSQRDVYKVTSRDTPWGRGAVPPCVAGRVVGVRYGRRRGAVVASIRLASHTHRLTLRYHDVPDVIDFLLLRHHYERAMTRRWAAGDAFRCVIDDCWWSGVVLDNNEPEVECERWEDTAAAQYLAVRVQWDNGEVERLSPWDLEPVEPSRAPTAPGGAVPVLARELEALAAPCEWPPGALDALATHIDCVMSLAIAEPFAAPVDLSRYPLYARVVPYPVDLASMRARCLARFYRRPASAQYDARYVATNAERFNEPHAIIVRQARLISDLLLYCICSWDNADVVGKYHELAASYRSSDDEPLRPSKVRAEGAWRSECTVVLRELLSSSDAEPFRLPVLPAQAPDYSLVVCSPMDLGTVSTRLSEGHYSSAEQFAADVRLVFANSRLYNTNKRSRIYSMTVRLSALFEALWSRSAARRTERVRSSARTRRTRRSRRNAQVLERCVTNGLQSASSESEPLAVTSRRVRARHSDAPLHTHTKGKGVGKKSKSSSASVEPGPSTSRARSEDHEVYSPPVANGRVSSPSPSSSSASSLRVEEEELPEEELDLSYTEPEQSASRRKRRISSDSEVELPALKPTKRTRERITDGSGSSSSCSGASVVSVTRYSSDHSYHPRDSSDDDVPLTTYTQRTPLQHKRGRVKLRARHSSRRYNEDSEEDSAAAISKRTHHHHHHHHHQRLADRRRQHADQSVRAEQSVPAPRNDHDYITPAQHTNGSAGAGSSGGAGAEAVSVSSRGRVRKLTAKARGLLRD